VQGDHDVQAQELIDEAERLQGPAHLEHRWVFVEHEPLWQRLTPAFVDAGWTTSTEVFMAHTHDPDRSADTSAVEEVDLDAVAAAEDRLFSGEAWARDAETRRQLLARARLLADVTGERRFAVRGDDGDVVAWAKLRRLDDIAQVEDVGTLTAHRGKGYARAAVTATLQAGRALDLALLFIVADDDDWPKELYARLGWDPIGRVRIFERSPGRPGVRA
jgi:RimJ/RimL family protein N-acetyltransferase